MTRPSRPSAAAVIPQREQGDPKEQYERIMAVVEGERDKLTRALAAVHVKPERFLTVVDQALRRSPDLLSCTPTSILKALLDAAELGLVPSGLIGQAYLVPYRNKRTGRKEAQLIPGYRGLIDLVRRSGELRSIEARVVREHDEFDIVFGTDGRVFHRPYINRTGEMVEEADSENPDVIISYPKDGGRYIGVYMIANLADNGVHVEWMSTAEVDAIRRRSKAASDGPWVTDWSEMAKKSVTRRGIKYLPLAIDSPVNRALALEDEAESAAIKVVTGRSDARTAFESALGIGAGPDDEPVGHDGDTDGDTTEPEMGHEQDTNGDTCAAPSPEDAEPCRKPKGHEFAHASENEVWPQDGES